MVYLKRLMGMFLIVTLSMTMMVSAASAHESHEGIISASVGTRVLFEPQTLNHFHFQKASVEPAVVEVTLVCRGKEPEVFDLTDDKVQEEFYNGEVLDCYALNTTEGSDKGRVNFSATFEEGHDH